jgi:hypothetical protein
MKKLGDGFVWIWVWVGTAIVFMVGFLLVTIISVINLPRHIKEIYVDSYYELGGLLDRIDELGKEKKA